ncbi:MAG: alpha/beta hydrolase [Acidimicrobiia bacterium]|nr:alpha/beta hydrolase [Acidimicrobiia bacterium]
MPEALDQLTPDSTALRRRLPVVILLSTGFIALVLLGLWVFQRQLVYLPAGAVPPVEDVLPGWSEVTLATTDGLQLGAWYSPPEPGRPVIVVFNGNAGNRADRAPLGARLASAGLGVLLVDYRGYGGNPGSPSEPTLALDARAAAHFVGTTAPGHGLVLFGESLGAAVAIELATEEPPAALILRSPFTSLVDVARAHYPLVPARFLRDEYPSDERVGALRSPLLVIVGSGDSVVPAAQSERLYELAPEPKELLVIPGADHNDFELLAGGAMIEAILRFVDTATAN